MFIVRLIYSDGSVTHLKLDRADTSEVMPAVRRNLALDMYYDRLSDYGEYYSIEKVEIYEASYTETIDLNYNKWSHELNTEVERLKIAIPLAEERATYERLKKKFENDV